MSWRLQELIAANDKCDVGRVMVNEDTYEVQAVSFNYLRREWQILDPAVAEDFKVDSPTPLWCSWHLLAQMQLQLS